MELNELEGLRFTRVTSSRAVPSTNLTGTWKFQLSTGSNTFIKSLRESMFILKGKLPQVLVTPDAGDNTAAANVLAKNMGFSQNVCGSLFASASLAVNGQELPAITDWKTYTSLNKALDSSFEEEYNSMNPMILTSSRYESGVGKCVMIPYSTQVGVIGECFAVNHDINNMLIHSKNHALGTAKITYANTDVFTIGFKFPFLDMLNSSEEFIGPNTHLSVTFQVSPTILTDFFFGLAAASAAIDFNEFQWVVPVYIGNPLTSVKLNRRYVEVETQRFSVSGSYYQVIAPSNLHRVAICLMHKSASDKQSNIPYKYTTGVGYPEWVSINIQYGGKSYPETQYRLGTTTENDWVNAYKDYVTFSQSYQSGELPVIKDFKTFLVHPVFVFCVRQSIGSVVSTPLNIHFDVGAQANMDLCVYMESVSELTFEYDDNGAVMQTTYEKIG